MRAQITPMQSMILEVLAARHRLGEVLWTFSADPGVVRALRILEGSGLVETMTGIVGYTVRASLTDAGRATALSATYQPPAYRALLWAQVDAWDEGYGAGLLGSTSSNPYHADALRAGLPEAEAQR